MVAAFLIAGTLFAQDPAGALQAGDSGQSRNDSAAVVAESENGFWLLELLNPFSGDDPETADEQYALSVKLREAGKWKGALKGFERVVKLWPESELAADAQRCRADLLMEHEKNWKAYDAYKVLIDRYGEQADGKVVCSKLISIATMEMKRKKMSFFFGGFQDRERVIPILRTIIKGFPGGRIAPQAQYMIGQILESGDKLEKAAVAYRTGEYAYPESRYAEKSAFAQTSCLFLISKRNPYNKNLRERAYLAAEDFLEEYPESKRAGMVSDFGKTLKNLIAKGTYDKAEYYRSIAKKPAAAQIYYERVVQKYSDTKWAESARKALLKMEQNQKGASDEK